MNITLRVRNDSTRKRLYRRDQLAAIANRICAGEGVDAPSDGIEISLLFCDDPFMAGLNEQYRGTRGPTDVLSFEQPGPHTGNVRLLGDIIVSLETVDQRCGGDLPAMRAEVRLLFCHGMLHLLGHDHETRADEQAMIAKQALYLGVDSQAAWLSGRSG